MFTYSVRRKSISIDAYFWSVGQLIFQPVILRVAASRVSRFPWRISRSKSLLASAKPAENVNEVAENNGAGQAEQAGREGGQDRRPGEDTRPVEEVYTLFHKPSSKLISVNLNRGGSQVCLCVCLELPDSEYFCFHCRV